MHTSSGNTAVIILVMRSLSLSIYIYIHMYLTLSASTWILNPVWGSIRLEPYTNSYHQDVESAVAELQAAAASAGQSLG